MTRAGASKPVADVPAPRAPPRSLADLDAYLVGAWRMRRRFHDARLGVVGRFLGTARVARGEGRLDYEEVGELEFGTHRGRASQRYLYAPLGPTAMTVRFADGRLFHTLDLASGVAYVAHDCGADRYRGRYRIIGDDLWSQVWRIEGPRKRLSIATAFWRIRG